MRTIPLKHLVDDRRPIMYGIVLPGPNQDQGPLIVKGGDVKPNRLAPDLLCKTTEEIEASYLRSRVRTSDVLIAIRGGIGDVELVPRSIDGANLTQDVARVSAKPGTDPRFIRYCMLSLPVQRDIGRRTTGATIKGLNIEELKELAIPAIPGEKQGAIADFLDAETARIDQLAERYATLADLAVERERTSIAWMLATLPFVKLKRVSSLLPGFSFPSESFGHAGVYERLLRGINVSPGAIDLRDCVRLKHLAPAELKWYQLLEGDVVVGMDRPFVTSGTRAARVSAADSGTLLVQRVCRLRFANPHQAELAYAALLGPRFVGHVEHSLTGVSVPHLSEEQIGDFEVPLLPMRGASEIVGKVREISERTVRLRSTCVEVRARLAERKQALITAAVTGQLDLAREIAEEAS